ncbi:helix-turn-helix domain-containing protein [Streptococcus macacae]|uniref:Transcriptional regulator, AraC family n=1 Tax=Streptococcus macacae NCTC 11558 TaxID=764298 RepID=G5JXU7_9STRE|nr:AraC family transcriptional regulator [Streptococcus macacae]EHJ52764.1 transcriptional regulator, AraC family [Streptococcus macacae NCTC 11558]SUN77654.1 AraC family transcriptional regulator [Streptococcus macacae NCTC 11558]
MKLSMSPQYLQFLSSIGVDFQTVLEKAQLPDSSWKEEMKLSTLNYYHLLQAFDTVLTDEQILAMSQLQNIQMFMPPFFAALSSQNGLLAIEHFAKYKKIIGPVIVEMTEFDDLVRVSFRYDHAGLDLPRFAVLNEQHLLLDMIRTGTGQDIKPVRLGTPYQYGPEVQAAFACHIELMEGNELIFTKADLDLPFLTANNIMLDYLEPQLKERLAENITGDSFTGIVQQKLYQAIPSGEFSIEDIAQMLGISSRTLQRNLSSEGTKFNQELQNVQKILALHYLKKPDLSTDEVAYLIGYAEVSSFSRAFKKWTGQTISQYRQKLSKR